MDLYKELGVSPDCTSEELKHAYRTLAQIHHPDKGGDEETFKKIKMSYEILSDPVKRANYDATGSFEQPRDINAEVLNELASLTMHFINKMDPINDDLIMMMKGDIIEGLKRVHNEISEITKQINKFEIIIVRIKSRKKENMLQKFTQNHIDNLKRTRKNMERRIELLNLMSDNLLDYFYSSDAIQAIQQITGLLE
jgi:curved DNA-binding protein CbpA